MGVIMTSRLAKPLALIASCLGLMLVQHHRGWAETNETRCPDIGSIYRPNPDDPRHRYVYRLRIEATSLADDPLQRRESWHFQLFDRDTKEKASESVLTESCPTGGLCTISRPGSHGENPYSVVVELTDDLRQVPDFSAPRVVILPGFADRSWRIGRNPKIDGDVRGKVVWVRISCGS